MITNWIGKYNSYLINKTNDAICFMVKKHRVAVVILKN